jgi:DNA-binding LytR/AlgR family response regulator
MNYRLKDLDARLDPARFVRLSRRALANLDLIQKIRMMPGGNHVAILTTGQTLQISRVQLRIRRRRFLRL